MQYFRTFEIQPIITLDEILWFVNSYGSNADINFGEFQFDSGMEFRAEIQLDYFDSLLKLHLESAINLYIDVKVINEFGRKNKNLDKILSFYKQRGIFGEKGVDVLSLQMDWHRIKKHVKPYDGIGYKIQLNGRRFLELMFCKISEEKGYLDIDRGYIVQSLYQYIIDTTDGKRNYNDEIVLNYRFDEYLDSRRIVFPLLIELEELARLKIMNISIKNNYIYFYISSISDISEQLFIDIIEKIPGKFYKDGDPKEIEKVEYTEEGVKINDVIWRPKGSKKTEAFLHLVSMYFHSNEKIKYIHVETLVDYYEKHKSLLVDSLKLNKKNIENSYMKTLSEKLVLDFEGIFLQIDRGIIEAKEDFESMSK